MASKTYTLEQLGDITVIKSKSNRHIKLTISTIGNIKVSIPTWAPYRTGLDFAKTKREWIIAKRPATKLLTEGQAIGRAHHLVFAPITAAKTRSRIKNNQIIVSYPSQLIKNDPLVQLAAKTAAIRALKKQAESLLPQRLANISEVHGITYSSIKVKQLSRRWGSCDNEKNIILNVFLIQLPWELIDYVILHELCHTFHLNHGPDFWQRLTNLCPEAKQRKKEINCFQPVVI